MIFEINNVGTCWLDSVPYSAIGFGTYPLQEELCRKAVLHAAQLGYQIIDTATFYKNFVAIGKALQMLLRNQFYVISKVWPDSQTPEKLQADIQTTLVQLQMEYIDAYLLHWPNSKIPIEDTLQTMEHLRLSGLVRHIGLSNVTVHHLKRALECGVPLSWVQVEMNPFFYDAALLEFCQAHSIVVQAWAPLARGRVTNDELLNQLGKKYGKTAAQIALKWVIQHRCIPLPGSKNPYHMTQNMTAQDFSLLQEDMDAIDERAKTGRRERVTQMAQLGFVDEFDFWYEECWPKIT